jgi:hypothetical protein
MEQLSKSKRSPAPILVIFFKYLILFTIAFFHPLFSESNNYSGKAYDIKTKQLQYSDHHSENISSSKHISSSIVYRDSSNKVFAKKEISFQKNSSLPDFKLVDLRDGYEEGGELKNNTYVLHFRKNSNSEPQQKILPIEGRMVADGGFDPFIKIHWNALLKGDKIKFKFVAPSQLDQFDFIVYKTKEENRNDRPTMILKMNMDNFLLKMVIPPITIHYDIETKRIVEYEGISNINNSSGKSLFVRIIYEGLF